MKIQSKDEFKAFIAKVEQGAGYKKPKAFGIAVLDRGQLNADKILQASFVSVNFNENYGSAAVMLEAFMQRGVKIDFSQSEFVQIVEKNDIEFALNFFLFCEKEIAKFFAFGKILQQHTLISMHGLNG